MKLKLLELLKDEEFIDESDKQAFLEYLKDPSTVLTEMTNVVGNEVALESHLPFSFYISPRNAVHRQHGIRTKLIWNPSRASANADGYMELHGNYEYVSGSHKYKPTSKELKIARDFFKKYKVLFAAVWEEVINPSDVQRYFWGNITFKQLLSKFYTEDFIDDNSTLTLFKYCNDLRELEELVRDENLFNMND